VAVASSPTSIEAVDDRVLVVACREGDDEAFAELVHRYHDTLRRQAQRRLRNVVDVDDAVQETFLRAFRSLHRVDLVEDAALGPWLARILANVCTDQAARQRRQAVVAERLAVQTPRSSESPEVDPVTAAALHRGLQALPEGHRQAFLLRAVADLPYRAIAERLGITEETARTRVLRARTTFRQDLARQGLPAAVPFGVLAGLLAGVRRGLGVPARLISRLLPSRSGRLAEAHAAHAQAMGAAPVTTGLLGQALSGTTSSVVAQGAQLCTQLCLQAATSPVVQGAVAIGTTGTGRGSLVVGLAATLATAGALALPTHAAPPSDHRLAPAAVSSASSPGASSGDPTLAVGPGLVPDGSGTIGTSSSGSAGTAGSSSAPGAAGSGSQAVTSTGSSGTPSTGPATSEGTSTRTSPAPSTPSTPVLPAWVQLAASAAAPASSPPVTTKHQQTTTSAAPTTNGSPTGTSDPATAPSTTASSSPAATSSPSSSSSSSSSSSTPAAPLVASPFPAVCTTLPGSSTAQPVAPPPIEATTLAGLVQGGPFDLIGSPAEPSLSEVIDGQPEIPGPGPISLRVQIAGCLGTSQGELLLTVTDPSGSEALLAGALVGSELEPQAPAPTRTESTSGTASPAGPSEAPQPQTGDFFFRGTVSSVAGSSTPLGDTSEFVALVQVTEPTNTLTLSVVLLDPTTSGTGS